MRIHTMFVFVTIIDKMVYVMYNSPDLTGLISYIQIITPLIVKKNIISNKTFILFSHL